MDCFCKYVGRPTVVGFSRNCDSHMAASSHPGEFLGSHEADGNNMGGLFYREVRCTVWTSRFGLEL